MELVTVVDIDESSSVANACKLANELDISIYLKVNSREDFNSTIDLSYDCLLEYSEYIIGLVGPTHGRLFEDTAYIATQLEDMFDIELESITTPETKNAKHIEELIDFFDDQMNIVISPVHDVTSPRGASDPISLAMNIERLNILYGYTNVTMQFDASLLPVAFMEKEVFLPLERFVSDIYYHISLHYMSNLNYDFSWLKYLKQYNADNKSVCLYLRPIDYVQNYDLLKSTISGLIENISLHQA